MRKIMPDKVVGEDAKPRGLCWERVLANQEWIQVFMRKTVFQTIEMQFNRRYLRVNISSLMIYLPVLVSIFFIAR